MLLGAVAAMTSMSSIAAPCDLARGQHFFESKCAMCHSAKKEDGNLVGPNLSSVLGRGVGKAANFNYSPALASAKDTWDEKALDAFLKAPAVARPGTIMPFSGIKNDQDRGAVTCFLKTQTR
jgi:cytochrome c